MKNWIFVVAMLCCSFFAHADEQKQKIYTSPDKIMVMPDGIFYMNEVGDFQPVSCVAYDEVGVYVVAVKTCDYCHRSIYRHASWCIYATPDW